MRMLKRAGLAVLAIAIVISAGLATHTVQIHGWQDIAVGTDSAYCGMAAQSHQVAFYCQSGR